MHIPAMPTGSRQFLPTNINGLIGWYSAKASATIQEANGVVTQIDNLVTGGLPITDQVTGGPIYDGGPTYDPSHAAIGGKPAIVWPDTLNNKGLTLGSDAMCSHVFVVCQYKDGLDATFDEYNTFFTPLNLSGTDRTIGNVGRARLFAAKQASINGAAFSTTVLPLPLSIVRFSAANLGAPIQLASIGLRTDRPDRSWQGAICEVLAFSSQVTLTAQQVQSIIDYLTAKWGIG